MNPVTIAQTVFPPAKLLTPLVPYLAPAAAGSAEKTGPTSPSPPEAPVSTSRSPSRPRLFTLRVKRTAG